MNDQDIEAEFDPQDKKDVEWVTEEILKILEEEITSPIKTSSDKKTYTLEGFDINEKELAELIYNGLESKMDFESVLNESEDSDTFNLAELLNTFKNVGATFGTNFNRSILEFEYEDDLNYKELLYGEKPLYFIKRLTWFYSQIK